MAVEKLDTNEFLKSVRNRKDKSKVAIINGDIGDDNYLRGAYAYTIGHGDLYRPEVFIIEQYENPIAINDKYIVDPKTVAEVDSDEITPIGKCITDTMIRIVDNWDIVELTHGSTYIDNNNTYDVSFTMAAYYSPERAIKMFPLLLMYHDCNNFPFVLLNARIVKH